MNRDLKRKLGNIALLIFILAAVIFFLVAIKMYLARVDEEVAKILEEADTTFIEKKGEEDYTGFYVANVKDTVLGFSQGKNISTIKYEFDGEPYFIEFLLEQNDVGEQSITITKIVNDSKGIRASMNLRNVVSISYRTGNSNQSSILKIVGDYETRYFAMTDGAYYFLGSDIDNISYRDGQFYHTSYNPNYLYLEETKSCSQEVIAQIDGFNKNDYYYRYGKINFLEEYYQKLSSKTYSVGDKCKEFETN